MTATAPATALPRLPDLDRALVRQGLRYGVVGGIGTALTAVSYLAFRSWWDAVPANLAAIVLSTLVTTEVNRRFTFGGAAGDRRRAWLQDLGTVAFYAAYGAVVLLLLGAVVDDPTPWEESAAVAAASVLGGVLRFLVLRNWVFATRRGTRGAAPCTGRPTPAE